MPGELLAIRDVHISAAEVIARKVMMEREKSPRAYKYIVGLSGETGSGKSEIAFSLANKLKRNHIRVKILHTDNYFKVAPLLKMEWRKAKGIETVGMDEYDWQLIHRNIQDFKEDRESMMPYLDAIPEQLDKLITDFKKIDLLVIEGLYAVKCDGADLRILIETPPGVGIPEDRNFSEHSREFIQQIHEREHQAVMSLKHLSDLIINPGFQVLNAKTKAPI